MNSQGDLIGVVSMTDIGRHLAEPSEFASSRRSDFYDIGDDVTLEQDVLEERAVAVRDVMPPWCTMSRPALRSQRRPHHGGAHSPPVVTQAREPVGIITSMDLLRVVAER